MVVHFYEIPRCACANVDGRPVLVAPAGTPPELLSKYDFLLLEDGRWCHFLTTPEYDHVMTGYPDRDVIFGDPNAIPAAPVQQEDPSAGNRMADIGLILLAAAILLPTAVTGILYLFQAFTETEESMSAEHPVLTALSTLMSSLGSLCGVGSFILMIITRVRYPKNTRGKVLMWIFVVLAILFALAMIALIIACAACIEELRHCPG